MTKESADMNTNIIDALRNPLTSPDWTLTVLVGPAHADKNAAVMAAIEGSSVLHIGPKALGGRYGLTRVIDSGADVVVIEGTDFDEAASMALSRLITAGAQFAVRRKGGGVTQEQFTGKVLVIADELPTFSDPLVGAKLERCLHVVLTDNAADAVALCTA